ncbi:hypothetical protein JA1_000106 [Spathaspora sp. JA1]|nr:hypothetical protein JA1_000106 [Spathaspora sp. JA1]
MVSFANVYWSSDYKSSIDQLQQESTTSLIQLHDLRKLVFSYIGYFTNNSEYLEKSSNELLPRSSPFNITAGSVGNSPTRRRIVSASVVASESAQNTPQPESVQSVTMSTAYNNYINHMKFDSQLLIQMASIIDQDVLEEITQFLKFQEPKLKGEVSRLQGIHLEYLTSVNKLDKLKSRHQEQLRLKEFHESVKSEETTEEHSFVEEDISVQEEESNSIEEEFDFPIRLATGLISNMEELRDLLVQLIDKVPIVKRKIPIPGYKNEIFSSDSLCLIVGKLRFRGFTPSRMNLEKFGQSLIDLNLITTSQFLNSKKFKSEGMWFEWSDLAYEVLNSNIPIESDNLSTTTSVSSSGQAKFQTEVAETTKRLNAMFNSVKSSIMKTNHDELLIDIQQKYEQELLTIEELKYRLEQGIFEASQFLQGFETAKIELVYKSLSRLSEILNRFTHKQAETLEHFSQDFLKRINKSVNYKHDLQILVEKFSTGIYFPGPNSNNQNLKYQFNLFKDIPLQLQLGQVESPILSINSIPYILYQAIKLVEKHPDLTQVQEYWISAIDHQTNWNMKQDIIMIISNYTPDLTDEISNERLIQWEFIKKIIEYLQTRTIEDVVCFIKSWLLEISDSCIPFVVYDSIVNIYQGKQEHDTVDELVKSLCSIPRSNLASLIFIIEHICHVFQLTVISKYQESDEIDQEVTEENTTDVSNKLNSMDLIGAVPFVHLIMRPSVVKNSTGFKPPIEIYGKFLADLLKLKVRLNLLTKLIDNETNIKQKRLQTEKNGLSLKRVSLVVPEVDITIPSTPTKEQTSSGTLLKSPRPVSGEFSLRPFRTKATPQPSPRGSPNHTRESSPTRPHSGSISTLLPPTVKLE